MKIENYKNKYHYKSFSGVETPFTPDQALIRVHEICGCKGCFDCDCVSVVNQAHSDLWFEHNTSGTRRR